MSDRTGRGVAITAPRQKLRYAILLWFLIGGIINYIDRAALSIAAPRLIDQLHFTATDIGYLGAAFSWAYAIMQLPAGWLIDRFGIKILYTAGLLIWSVAEFFTGFATVLWVFILLRLLLGMGEAPCFPVSAKSTSIWFPARERGFASSIWDTSSKWAPAFAPALLTWIMLAFGWREMFAVTGVMGVIFALLFFKFYKNPDKSKRLKDDEYSYIKAGGGGIEHMADTKTTMKEWITLFRFRATWGMMLGYFCTIWIWNIFLVFLPLYLIHAFHISLAEMGALAGIPWIGGAFGELAGGYISKTLAARGIATAFNAKRIVIGICAVLAGICVVIIPLNHSLPVAIGLLTISLAFISSITGNAWGLAGDVAPASKVASLGSIQNFGGYFGGTFSPILAGAIVDSTGSYSLAFTSGGIIAACAALCYLLILRKPISKAGWKKALARDTVAGPAS